MPLPTLPYFSSEPLSLRTITSWFRDWSPDDVGDVEGKNAVVTGGNSGLGLEICTQLAKKKANIYLVSRNLDRGHKAASEIRVKVPGAKVEVVMCNMDSLRDVTQLIEKLNKLSSIDYLFCNAGVFYIGHYAQTEDGLEMEVGVNFWSHAWLALGLLDKMAASGSNSRIIMMGSMSELLGWLDWNNLKGDKSHDSGLFEYGQSKLYMTMFCKALAARLAAHPQGRNVDVMVVHPGLVKTPMANKANKTQYLSAMPLYIACMIWGLSLYKGALPALYAALAPELAGKGFKYIGPNLWNMWPTVERLPANPNIWHMPRCQRLFDEVVRVLEQMPALKGKTVRPAVLSGTANGRT